MNSEINTNESQKREGLLDTPILPTENNEEDDIVNPRGVRQFTINFMAFNKNFNKLIIPYDFDLKNYFIKKEEIDFYEYKDYVADTLDRFCKDPVFNIEKKYKPKGFEKFLLFIPNFIMLLVILYVFIFIAFLTYCNPAILFISFIILKKGYSSLRIMRFIFKEKAKIKEVKRKLEMENNSPFCIEKKINWALGDSGYWIELVKNI